MKRWIIPLSIALLITATIIAQEEGTGPVSPRSVAQQTTAEATATPKGTIGTESLAPPTPTGTPSTDDDASTSMTYTGYMGDDVPDEDYVVYLETGQMIEVTALADRSDLDPYIFLFDPDGMLVMKNDDQDKFTLDSYFRYSVPAAGDYTVVLSNIQGTAGEFELTITYGPDSGTGNYPSFEWGPGTYRGYMGDDVSNNYYMIYLEAGQMVMVTALADQSDLDPYLLLLNAEGDLVMQNDDQDKFTLDSYFRYSVPFSGTYTVVLSNIQDTAGEFELTISYGTDSGAGNYPSVERGPGTYRGYMGDDVSNNYYTVYLEVGQVLSVSTKTGNNGLDTIIYLSDPGLSFVAENDDRDHTTRDSFFRYTALVAGDHTITLSNIANTSGDYRIIIAISE